MIERTTDSSPPDVLQPEEKSDKKEKGFFSALIASFKELIKKIQELRAKKKLNSKEKDTLDKCQTEKLKRKNEFFSKPFGKKSKEKIEKKKEEIEEQAQEIIEDIKDKPLQQVQEDLAKLQKQRQESLTSAQQEDEKIEEWEKKQSDVEEGRYAGIAEDEIEESLEKVEKDTAAVLKKKQSQASPFGASSSEEELVDKALSEKVEQARKEGRQITPSEKLEAYSKAQKEFANSSYREPFSEMYKRQIRKEISGTHLRPEQLQQAEGEQELLEMKMREWLKEKLKGISNVGGQTREHQEATGLLRAFLEQDRLSFRLIDEQGNPVYKEIKISKEIRELYEAWTKLHDIGEYFNTSGSPEDIKRTAGMLDAKYFGVIMQEKDKKTVRYTCNGETREVEIELGAADFLDLYDTERWGQKVIAKDKDEKEKAKQSLAEDVVATALGLKKWNEEEVPDFEIEYQYLDEQGKMRTAKGRQGVERVIEDFRWANNFAERFYHLFGRVAYQDVGFKSEVKDWQVKVLRFTRYCHKFGIGVPELRDACDLDFRGFITRRRGELFPMFDAGGTIFSRIKGEDKKKKAQKALEKLVFDQKKWIMSRDRIVELAEKSYQGETEIESRNLSAEERSLFDQLDFSEEFKRIGIEEEGGARGLEGFIRYIENLGYSNIDWTSKLWGQRGLKYFQYLSNANDTRGLMMGFLRQPSFPNLIALMEKGGFGYYDADLWSEKCKKIEKIRHWGLKYHLGSYEKMETGGATSSVKEGEDEEGNIVYKKKRRIGGVPWRHLGFEKVPAYEWKREIEGLLMEQMIQPEAEKELKEDFLEWGIPSFEIPETVPFIGGARIAFPLVGLARRIRIGLSYIPIGDFLLNLLGKTLERIVKELQEMMKES